MTNIPDTGRGNAGISVRRGRARVLVDGNTTVIEYKMRVVDEGAGTSRTGIVIRIIHGAPIAPVDAHPLGVPTTPARGDNLGGGDAGATHRLLPVCLPVRRGGTRPNGGRCGGGGRRTRDIGDSGGDRATAEGAHLDGPGVVDPELHG
jgi:hypothetical protein